MLSKFKEQLNKKGEVYLKIKVRPGKSKTSVKDVMDDEAVKIDVAAAPEKGKANQELIKFMAKEFEISRKNVIIISGAKEKVKLVKIVMRD